MDSSGNWTLVTNPKSWKRRDGPFPEENAAVLALPKDLKPGDGGDETKATGVKNSCNARLALSPLYGEGGDETKAMGEKKSSKVRLVRCLSRQCPSCNRRHNGARASKGRAQQMRTSSLTC
jgi:hypothetical protein